MLLRSILTALILSAVLALASTLGAPARGLQAEYFASDAIGGSPALAGIDAAPTTAAMQQRWVGSSPQVFAARWFGFASIRKAGRYTIILTSDDGAVLSLDGRVAIDNSTGRGLQTHSTVLDLEPGPHAFALTFNQHGGTFDLVLQWSRNGETPAPLPDWAFTTEKKPAAVVAAWHYVDVAARALLLLAAVLLPAAAWQQRHRLAGSPRAAAFALFAVLAVAHTWPLASDPGHLTRHDNRDAVLNAWIVGWVAHQLPRDPLHLYDGNVFHPERLTLAYSEPMVVQAVLAMPLIWAGASLVLAYNLLLLAGMTLSGWTMALVVRRWTDSWPAGLVAGSVFAFSAHTLSRIPHLQAQHVEFLPLALLALDRVYEAPTTRNALRLAGWFILQGLTSVYLLVFSTFALLAAALARAADLRRHPLFTLRGLAIAGLVSAAVLTPFLLPYWWVSRDLGIVRSLGDAENFAATWRAYLTTPARVHAAWSARFADGNVLFPGALGLLLTLVSVVSGAAWRDRRARMALAVGLAGLALSFGSKLPGYGVLYAVMPLLHGIRATARFGWLVTFAVAILAGFGVEQVRRRVRETHWPAVAAVLVIAAAIEPLAAPLGLQRYEGLAPLYARMPRGGQAVAIELPFPGARSVQFNAHYMLNSTEHWQPIVNGYSGLQPPSYYRNLAALEHFPDAASLAHLRALGVTHVFLHEDQVSEATLAAVRATPALVRDDGFGAIGRYQLTR